MSGRWYGIIINGDTLFRILITPMLKLYVYMSKINLDPTKKVTDNVDDPNYTRHPSLRPLLSLLDVSGMVLGYVWHC